MLNFCVNVYIKNEKGHPRFVIQKKKCVRNKLVLRHRIKICTYYYLCILVIALNTPILFII